MPNIQIDHQTEMALQTLATAAGLNIEQYLAILASQARKKEPRTLSEAEFDAELNALTHHGPSLPPDFSRADIYADHD